MRTYLYINHVVADVAVQVGSVTPRICVAPLGLLNVVFCQNREKQGAKSGSDGCFAIHTLAWRIKRRQFGVHTRPVGQERCTASRVQRHTETDECIWSCLCCHRVSVCLSEFLLNLLKVRECIAFGKTLVTQCHVYDTVFNSIAASTLSEYTAAHRQRESVM